MNDKIVPGDMAVVVHSVFGQSVGKIVKCLNVAGIHSKHGTIWTVDFQKSEFSIYGEQTTTLDMPEKWLRKIMPDPYDDEIIVREITEELEEYNG